METFSEYINEKKRPKLKGKFFGVRWESESNEVTHYVYSEDIKKGSDLGELVKNESPFKKGTYIRELSVYEVDEDTIDDFNEWDYVKFYDKNGYKGYFNDIIK